MLKGGVFELFVVCSYVIPSLGNDLIIYMYLEEGFLVNGENINDGLYPVLNYKPEGAAYPYVYVSIAEFERVGAKVIWDEEQKILIVT